MSLNSILLEKVLLSFLRHGVRSALCLRKTCHCSEKKSVSFWFTGL